MAKAPYSFVKHRIPEGTINHSDRIDRYWKCRKTGNFVQVVRYLNVANENRKVIIFVSELMPGRELSSDLEVFKRDHEPKGNRSDKF